MELKILLRVIEWGMKTAKDGGGEMGGELESCIEDYTTALVWERLGGWTFAV